MMILLLALVTGAIALLTAAFLGGFFIAMSRINRAQRKSEEME